jgi:hypothetical protein
MTLVITVQDMTVKLSHDLVVFLEDFDDLRWAITY